MTMSSRKDDHVRLAREFHADVDERQHAHMSADVYHELDGVQFVHNALPQTNLSDVDISAQFAGISSPRPYFINAMTGGTDHTQRVNYRLACVAEQTATPMALGSMSIAVRHPEVQEQYAQLCRDFPDVTFIANLGAEHSAQSAQHMVDLIGARALQIHINAAQEIVMPEGDKDFTQWLGNIERIVATVDVPVIVKEVGCGLSRETVEKLYECGVRTVDVAGRGGTNFVRIENARHDVSDYSYLEGWGLSTLRSLIEALHVRSAGAKDLEIVASGGVRHPLDAVRYLAMGADMVGMSGVFLHSILSDDEAHSQVSTQVDDQAIAHTVDMIAMWDTHIAQIMTLLGCDSITTLREHSQLTYPASLVEYARQRGVSVP